MYLSICVSTYPSYSSCLVASDYVVIYCLLLSTDSTLSTYRYGASILPGPAWVALSEALTKKGIQDTRAFAAGLAAWPQACRPGGRATNIQILATARQTRSHLSYGQHFWLAHKTWILDEDFESCVKSPVLAELQQYQARTTE